MTKSFEIDRIEIVKSLESDLLGVSSMHDLLNVKAKFLGKKSAIAEYMFKIPALSIEEKKVLGAAINNLRSEMNKKIEAKQSVLHELDFLSKLNAQSIDVTLPGRNFSRGYAHPISVTTMTLKKIFYSMGFEHVDGPEIEDDWHNFTALNIDELHPARQMHDTFYLQNIKMLLRTHTSCVQIRRMKEHKPPIRIISTGRVYRADHDATHTPMFHQIEGLVIGESITFAHLKWCVSNFLSQFFALKDIPMRWRSSYFPFTEPSAEIDIRCDRSEKDSIKIGKGDSWLEIMGCGMVHSQVLENVGIDPKVYQGFAFGVGIERLIMLKYNISDLRTLFEGDARRSCNFDYL